MKFQPKVGFVKFWFAACQSEMRHVLISISCSWMFFLDAYLSEESISGLQRNNKVWSSQKLFNGVFWDFRGHLYSGMFFHSLNEETANDEWQQLASPGDRGLFNTSHRNQKHREWKWGQIVQICCGLKWLWDPKLLEDHSNGWLLGRNSSKLPTFISFRSDERNRAI